MYVWMAVIYTGMQSIITSMVRIYISQLMNYLVCYTAFIIIAE